MAPRKPRPRGTDRPVSDFGPGELYPFCPWQPPPGNKRTSEILYARDGHPGRIVDKRERSAREGRAQQERLFLLTREGGLRHQEGAGHGRLDLTLPGAGRPAAAVALKPRRRTRVELRVRRRYSRVLAASVLFRKFASKIS